MDAYSIACRPAGTVGPPGGCCFAVDSPSVGRTAGPFGGPTDLRHVITQGQVQEVRIAGVEAHPIHFHTVPLQLAALPPVVRTEPDGGAQLPAAAEGNFAAGDWVDSVQLPGVGRGAVTARFRADRYAGDQGCVMIAAMRPADITLP
eukprot:gene51156-20446_t